MNSAVKTAYLLVTHGSRDPRSQAGAEQLARQLRQRFGLEGGAGDRRSWPETSGEEILAIATAVLELGSAPLHCQIEQFARKVALLGVSRIKLLPLFLLPGVHVREDLPEELCLAEAALAASPVAANPVAAAASRNAEQAGSGLSLELLPHIGDGEAVMPVLKAQQQALCQRLYKHLKAQGARVGDRQPALAGVTGGAPLAFAQTELNPDDVDWVILAHGSRRPGAGQAIERLAHSLGAKPAYWVGAPSLEDCLEGTWDMDGEGFTDHHRPLGLLSYFLFEGGITDRLQGTLQRADSARPAVMSAPLGAFPALATVVARAMVASSLTREN